jgi:glutamine amidotransferase
MIPDYVTPDMERFRIASLNNPDGFGFAISTGKTIIKAHSMNFEEVANKFTDLRATNKGPALFHFRIATHGSETIDNCHPFTLGQDPDTVLAHNGILPVAIPKGDKRSDTKVFAEDIMPGIGGITSLDDNDYFAKLALWAAGSKLAFLTVHDEAKFDWYIINEKDGHWDKDMWWSNSSYRNAPIVYSTRPYSDAIGWSDSWDYGYKSYSGYSSSTSGVHVATEDYDDEAGLLEADELDKCLEQFQVFMTDIGAGGVLIECYSCAASETTSDVNCLQTHCNACSACLFCGSDYGCTCWDALEGVEMIAEVEQEPIPMPVEKTYSSVHPSYY